MLGYRRLFLLVVSAALTVAAGSVRADPFSFVALGDTAYRTPEDYPAYQSLIARINAADPVFSIHIGDTWGLETCSRADHERIRDFFAEYQHPVMYTPGDNEWVDCVKPELVPRVSRRFRGTATREDLAALRPLATFDGRFERRAYANGADSLALIRKVFFSEAKSLGARPRSITRQADISDFDEMVENTLWEHEGVVFGTVHVVGSRNNFFIDSPERAAEASARNRANLAWLRKIFAEAESRKAKAVVVATHASLFTSGPFVEGEPARPIRDGDNGPYFWVATLLRDLAEEFARPVLLIHGDFHEYVVDRPFLVSRGEFEPPRYANLTRLQVYGAPELGAVRVTVEPDTPWVFGFTPLHD